MDSDTRRIVKELKKQGFEVNPTKGNHIEIRKDGRRVATAASTPSDCRAMKNLIAELRKAGFTWQR